jgi:hypothetical protein
VVDDDDISLVFIDVLCTNYITTHVWGESEYHISNPLAYAVDNNTTLVEWIAEEEGYPR